jgi:hypothetical protein
MRLRSFFIIVCFVPLFLGNQSTLVRGDEREEIKHRIVELQNEMLELQGAGKLDLANTKAKELLELTSALRRMERNGREGDVQQKLHQVDVFQGNPNPNDRERAMRRLQQMGERIRHIREASEHLKAAELHDQARDLMRRAEKMEEELRQAKERFVDQRNAITSSARPEGGASWEARRAREVDIQRELAREQEVHAREQEMRARAQVVPDAQVLFEQNRRQDDLQTELGGALRQLREENEQMRREMRELAMQIERIGGEFKRLRPQNDPNKEPGRD